MKTGWAAQLFAPKTTTFKLIDVEQAEELLKHLDPDQAKAARALRGPVCIRAGAGTGKTRAITYRIAYGVRTGVYHPYSVLAVTFTVRAAAEMAARLRLLGVEGVQARTFHSAALRQLRYFWPTAVGGQLPKLIENKSSLVGAVASRLGLPKERAAVRDYCAAIEMAAVGMVAPEDYGKWVKTTGLQPPAGISTYDMADILRGYSEAKKERSVIDFEDVLALTCGMIEERPDIAGQIRSQYRFFVVDEYQDISPLQKHLLELWLGESNRDLCVVGDAAQTIYSFAGATPEYLVNFAQEYPGAHTVTLSRDYRSTPQIVSFANGLVNRDKETKKQAVKLTSMRESGSAVHFERYPDDEAEAAAIAKMIKERITAGTPASDIAVLFRTNAQSSLFEAALAHQEVKYWVRGTKGFFKRPEVSALLKQASLIARRGAQGNPGEIVAELARPLGWSQQAPATQGALLDRWEALNALVAQAQLKEAAGLSLASLVQEWQELAEAQLDPSGGGVTLASIHSAKGLEWKTVFLVGVSEGLLPITQAKSVKELTEERRLAYVAVTRARDELFVSYAQKRSLDRKATRACSRFFSPVWPREESAVKTVRTPSTRQDTKRFLKEASPEEQECFERLRQWRLMVAQGQGKPAYTVFSDTTLRDIATAKPQTLKQLSLLRGIGPVKLEQFGAAVLRILRGADPEQVAHEYLSGLSD